MDENPFKARKPKTKLELETMAKPQNGRLRQWGQFWSALALILVGLLCYFVGLGAGLGGAGVWASIVFDAGTVMIGIGIVWLLVVVARLI
jgi:hypothetical protein